MPLELHWSPRIFLEVERWLCVPGLRMFRHAFTQLLTTSGLSELPTKAQEPAKVFSESSNPHRPGQGATVACARAKYVPGGCWFRKLMPGHPRQNEEMGRNCFAG
jgi:hypothetical protein